MDDLFDKAAQYDGSEVDKTNGVVSAIGVPLPMNVVPGVVRQT